jgi:hypothetical protein
MIIIVISYLRHVMNIIYCSICAILQLYINGTVALVLTDNCRYHVLSFQDLEHELPTVSLMRQYNFPRPHVYIQQYSQWTSVGSYVALQCTLYAQSLLCTCRSMKCLESV